MSEPQPVRPARRRRKDARPAELLQAALSVFLERGFAAARMDEIAARAGVAKGTVYLYFPSKEDIFKALVQTAAATNVERLEREAAAFGGPASALIRQILTFAMTALKNPQVASLPKLILAEAATFPDLVQYYRTHLVERMLRLLAGIHRRGVEAGEFGEADSNAVARLIAAPVLMSALWRSVMDPDRTLPPDSDTVLRTHIDILLRGLRAEGKTP
jgi:AcrR family transcriptional regulator